jgi:hypothetical protein
LALAGAELTALALTISTLRTALSAVLGSGGAELALLRATEAR